MRYCTVGCRAAANEVASAHRLRETLGESEATDAYLDAAERLAAAWSTVQEHRYQLRRLALDVGFEPQQWSALVRGYVDPLPRCVEAPADAEPK